MYKTSILLVSHLFLHVASFSQNAPIDFEEMGHGADWSWTVFENGSNPSLEIVANPYPSAVNSSSTVAKFTALTEGAPWAGCESLHGSDIGTFTIDADNAIIRISVWKSEISDVGIKLVRVDNWSLGEIKIANTVINEWEQISFDFSDHLGLTYDQIVVFPDFTDRDAEHIIYFDNIMGPEVVETSIEELNTPNLIITPNPATNVVSIQSSSHIEQINIFDVNGKLMLSKASINNASRQTLDIESLADGLYLVQILSSDGSHSQQFVKH